MGSYRGEVSTSPPTIPAYSLASAIAGSVQHKAGGPVGGSFAPNTGGFTFTSVDVSEWYETGFVELKVPHIGILPGLTVRFITSAPEFELRWRLNTTNASQFTWRVKVDGQYVNSTGFGPTTSAAHDYQTAFQLIRFGDGSAAHAKPRLIEVECAEMGGIFGGYNAAAKYTPSPAPQADQLRVLAHGDSFLEPLVPDLKRSLGQFDIRNVALGGTGFVAINGERPNAVDRVERDVTPARAHIVVDMNGINDASGITANAYADVVASWIRSVLRSNPACVIVMTGPMTPNGNFASSADLVKVSEGKKQAASRFPENVIYIDNIGEKWVTGTGRVGNLGNDGNADWITGTDGTHPTVEGRSYLTMRLAHSLATKLPAFIAEQEGRN
jgi:lysophospholipase L1-like esterase